MNDLTATFPPIFPVPWACEWGEDRFGLFMVLDCRGVRQRFRWVASGSFLMGSPENEAEREDDERQHPVTLTQGFWFADSACTQELWMAVMTENPSGFQDNPEKPVENVSWDDAQQFIARLNEAVPELHARLPSEAEWEYACRAGTMTPFSFGENITPEQVNYNGKYPYAGGVGGLNREKTVPVKSLSPNPWGLYEMHGNVWEWCADWYGVYDLEERLDPKGPPEGSSRVLRGGSWFSNGRYARSAFCNWHDPADRDIDIGFRLALGRPGASGQERQESRRAAAGRSAPNE